MRKEGRRLIIEPIPPRSLLAVLATLSDLEEEFPPISDICPSQSRRSDPVCVRHEIVSELVRDLVESKLVALRRIRAHFPAGMRWKPSSGVGPQMLVAPGVHSLGRCGVSRCQGRGSK